MRATLRLQYEYHLVEIAVAQFAATSANPREVLNVANHPLAIKLPYLQLAVLYLNSALFRDEKV